MPPPPFFNCYGLSSMPRMMISGVDLDPKYLNYNPSRDWAKLSVCPFYATLVCWKQQKQKPKKKKLVVRNLLPLDPPQFQEIFTCVCCCSVFAKKERTTLRQLHKVRRMASVSDTIEAGPSEVKCVTLMCPVCNKTLQTEGEMKEHLVTHSTQIEKKEDKKPAATKERPYKCSDCGQTHATRLHLEMHREAHTRKQVTFPKSTTYRPYKCEHCGQTFASPAPLEQHLKGHANDGVTYECPICTKVFAKKYTLKKHLQNCVGKKVYECAICGRNFSGPNRLKQHMVSHAVEKPFECDKCFKAYPRMCDLLQHQRYHPKPEPTE